MHPRPYQRKITSSITFTLLLIFIIAAPSNFSVVAWNNGSYAYDPQDYDYETDYGTHDWIADATLDYLLNHNATHWNWLDTRREIFYVGTEAPDNSGIDIVLDGVSVAGIGDVVLHHIYFYENGNVVADEDDSAIRAKEMGDLAETYILAEKWDLAAYYLGAMTHYIADMSLYSQVAENNVDPHYLNFDEHQTTVKGYVNTRTNEVGDTEEFIRLNLSPSILAITPYNAAIYCAWDTYMDPTPTTSEAHGAVWLHENFFSGWVLTTELRDAETNVTMTEYYDRIEENLNMAIESCIGAMRYAGGEPPVGGGDSDGDGLLNDEETDTYFTDPYDEDSDDDGLLDGEEVITYLTDPNDD
ncbi:MAG: hypothetical protein ACTSRK_20615, partial [Promethearchaeota archaeon]